MWNYSIFAKRMVYRITPQIILFMKKHLLLLIVATLLPVFSMNAQSLQFGVKGGVSFMEVNDNRHDDFGWFVGPMLDMALPVTGLSVDVSALYHREYYHHEYHERKYNYVNKHIEVPLNLKWDFWNGESHGLYLGGGPQLTYIMDSDRYANHWATSFNVGGGVKLWKCLRVGINYNLPLGRTYRQVMYGGSPWPLKRKGLWMSVSYLL